MASVNRRELVAAWRLSGLEQRLIVTYTGTMQRWKTVLAMLIALWLPLQGYAAVAMPFCQHNMGAAMSTHAEKAGHSRHQHAGRSAQMAHGDAHGGGSATFLSGDSDKNNANGLACNNCGACHLACSPSIAAIARAFTAVGNPVFGPTPAESPRSFFPEQLQRPPLSALPLSAG